MSAAAAHAAVVPASPAAAEHAAAAAGAALAAAVKVKRLFCTNADALVRKVNRLFAIHRMDDVSNK